MDYLDQLEENMVSEMNNQLFIKETMKNES